LPARFSNHHQIAGDAHPLVVDGLEEKGHLSARGISNCQTSFRVLYIFDVSQLPGPQESLLPDRRVCVEGFRIPQNMLLDLKLTRYASISRRDSCGPGNWTHLRCSRTRKRRLAVEMLARINGLLFQTSTPADARHGNLVMV